MMDQSRKHRRRPDPRKKTLHARLKPGADARLRKVFAAIGVPEKKPFKPDRFQTEAVEAINRSDCLVTAPTGAGKTWIAEQAIAGVRASQGKAWYASPLKALTNAKYEEFSQIFGPENLGILTGDRKENPDASIIVGTTEILRNQLYDAMHRGQDLDADLVILDEAHFLGDAERGVVWEEIMIYLPSRIPMLLLSATVGNARQIADWLASIRGKACIVIEENRRPVPLFTQTTKPRLHTKIIKYLNARQSSKMRYSRQLPPMGDILCVLKKYRLLPAIFFLKSRADCDNAVRLCASAWRDENDERQELRRLRIKGLVSRFPHIAEHKQMPALKSLGVGAHHSGQLPAWKIMIETLMTEGLLDAVFATSTVAAGVNFPARTILFLNSDRFNGREFLPLTPTEFHQMTGRAGRRGMDNIGFAVLVPGKFMDTHLVGRLFSATASDVHSQIRINFSMVLNLLLSHTPKQVRDLLGKSFAAYLIADAHRKNRLRIANEDGADALWDEFLRHLDFLKEKAYVAPDDRLTDDGEWASRLRIDHPLMVAEAFRKNLFPKSDPARLAGIIAAFVNERETDDEAIDRSLIPRALAGNFTKIKNGLKPFATEMRSNGFDAPNLFFLPALTIYLWAKGWAWEKLVGVSNMAEGDLAMLILRTADNLRHIRNIGEVFPDAAEASIRAIELILKDPVLPSYEV